MDDDSPVPGGDDDAGATSETPVLVRIGAAAVAIALVALVAAVVLGVGRSTSAEQDASNRVVLLAVVLWATAVALVVASVGLLRRTRPAADRREATAAQLGAIRAGSVLLAVSVTAVALWVTLDRATNLSSDEIGDLLTVVGDDLAGDSPPSQDAVEAALAAEIDEPDVEDDAYTSGERPSGLTVVRAGLAGDVTAFQVTDDDGGSPFCLQFLRAGGVESPAGPYTSSVEEGLC